MSNEHSSRLEALSIMAPALSLEELRSYIPGISCYMFKKARLGDKK